MQDRGYLLNVAGVNAAQAQILEKLDAERLNKLNAARTADRKRACAGAGLLIQWALRETLQLQKTLQLQEAQGTSAAEGFVFWREPDLEELLSGLGEPLPVSYVYGDKGKPYFRDVPLFFNLSHSGDYVACVLSEREIGVDIQRQKPVDVMRMGRRFFHEREKDFLSGLSEEAQRKEWFYRLWCRKEAYGKMTGDGIISLADGIISLADGIVSVAAMDFTRLDADWLQGTDWQEYGFLDGYQIACCGRKYNTRYDC